jgi:putative ABC transport system ATP-binding protein
MAKQLDIRDVSARRPAAQGVVTLLDGVSFSAQAGELTLVIGPSGSGKSTLARLLNRLDDCDAGQINLDGQNITAINPQLLRRKIGLLGQKPVLFAGSVHDNLQLPAKLQRIALPSAEDLKTVLSLCQLDPGLLEREAGSLSIGQQQRVCLARALINAPEVLVLDEPTSALDRPTADRLADTLRHVTHQKHLIVVLVTHDLRLAGRIADQLIFLVAGQVIETGPAQQLLHSPQSAALREFLADPPTPAEVRA